SLMFARACCAPARHVLAQRSRSFPFHFLFFFTQPPPTHLPPLSLHNALPISPPPVPPADHASDDGALLDGDQEPVAVLAPDEPRSEEHRLNSSHVSISYAVFCLKKKTPYTQRIQPLHVHLSTPTSPLAISIHP